MWWYIDENENEIDEWSGSEVESNCNCKLTVSLKRPFASTYFQYFFSEAKTSDIFQSTWSWFLCPKISIKGPFWHWKETSGREKNSLKVNVSVTASARQVILLGYSTNLGDVQFRFCSSTFTLLWPYDEKQEGDGREAEKNLSRIRITSDLLST